MNDCLICTFTICTDCKGTRNRKEYFQNYYENNQQNIKAYQKAYRKDNKESIAKKKKVYYLQNREAIRKKDKIRYEKLKQHNSINSM